MQLDREVCFRAIASRDARFDGQFFTAVRTTRIFCRPICPARAPLRQNITFYPTAAAALEAGYRPCLRCRPEVSPDMPAWLGTSTTVARALRMIAAGALDTEPVAAMAARLGVGERHLRRLFEDHLGAAPASIALARRVLFAKQLITETGLSMTEIAAGSGFQSIRRFNGAILKVYRRSPSELRRSKMKFEPGLVTLKLAYHGPYDWTSLIRFLGPRAIPGVESVSEDCYRRTIRAGGARGEISVRRGGSHLLATIRVDDTAVLGLVVERLRRLFDLRAVPDQISDHLASDPMLRPFVRPGLRVPGAWDGFELAVRAVLGQQVTVKGATTLAGRIAAQYGEPFEGGYLFPEPQVLAEADFATIGLPGKRVETLRNLAAEFAGPAPPLVEGVGLEESVRRLRALPGIGDWTAHYIAMRALNEPDAFPSGDLGLQKATGLSAKRLEQASESWRPWRAYAAMTLWLRELS